MDIHELKPELKQVATETVIQELKAVGIELDVNSEVDRRKAQCLATNLRIEFNHLGGLA